jgi:glyoxylase-like metal-dependent hydrolase (beta-lactamase superfamily II)
MSDLGGASIDPAGWSVTIVKYGTRAATRDGVFLNYEVYGEPDGELRMDYFFWVLRNGDAEILVDTGFSIAGGAARNRSFVLEPDEAFRRAAIDPATTAEVLLTHGHFDHIGNIDKFPAARFTIAQAELEFWTGPNAHQPLFHHSVEDSEVAGLVAAHEAGRVRTFAEAIDIAPGVRMVEVGGHTPGQAIVLVDTAEGTVLLASDSVHYYEELERDMPFVSVADVVGMYDAFRMIRSLAETGEVAHVVSGHDPATLERFTPATGELAGYAATIGAQA